MKKRLRTLLLLRVAVGGVENAPAVSRREPEGVDYAELGIIHIMPSFE